MNARKQEIDIMRGVLIVLMVIEHSGIKYSGIINIFHMSCFVLLGGYCFDEKNANSTDYVIHYLKRKLKRIWIPYVMYNGIAILLHNTLVRWSVYWGAEVINSDNPIVYSHIYSKVELIKYLILNFFLIHTEPICGAIWFLRVYFYVCVVFCVIMFVLKMLLSSDFHGTFMIPVIIMNAVIGLICNKFGLLQIQEISTMFTYFMLYGIGFFFKRVNWDMLLKKHALIMLSFVFIASFGIQGERFKGFSIHNDYTSFTVAFFAAISGWIITWYISACVLRKSNVLGYLGRHTISILAIHFIGFKISIAVQFFVYRFPIYLVSCLPSFSYNKWWIPINIFFGLMIPIMLDKLFAEIRKGLIRKCDLKITGL